MKSIPLFKVYMAESASSAVSKVLGSGYIGQGPKVEEFENELKSWFNHDYCVSLNSGTSGLHLALHLLRKPFEGIPGKRWAGLQNNDEVLATPLTCTASNWPILANNFNIKWVDIDPTTMNMDLDDLARKVTPKTRAIMLVHWGGYPVDLDRVKEIQTKAFEMYGFKPAVIEDCAHSLGSTYKGKKIGTHGNICMFSFQAIKHLTSVDGGLLTLPYQELYNRAKLIRWYGIDRESNRKDFRCEADILEWGFKFHMNDVCAAVGLENLRHVDEVITKHQDNAKFYNDNLIGIDGITLLENNSDRKSAYWLYTIKVRDRDNFIQTLKSKGVASSRVHERNDKHTCVQEYISSLPNLDKVIKEMVCIPVGWWVTPEDRQYVVDCIKEGW
jgi:dTDP-4-amino-4,6-dideoxygalactose transaminase